MKKPTALVIEDDYDAAAIMSAALTAAGYDVAIFHDGAAARQALATTVPDLVALDLHLPSVSGDQLLAEIRADARLADVRVMLVTADDRLAENIADDADLVLLKPVTVAQLRMLAQRLAPQN